MFFLLFFPFVAGKTGVWHGANHWLRWGLTKFLLRLASNHSPPDLCLPSSSDDMLEP
jgi:hypothetical protein